MCKLWELLQLKCLSSISLLYWTWFHGALLVKLVWLKPIVVTSGADSSPADWIKAQTVYGLDDLRFTLVWARWLVWRTTKSKIYLCYNYNFLWGFFFLACFASSRTLSHSLYLWTFCNTRFWEYSSHLNRSKNIIYDDSCNYTLTKGSFPFQL